MSSKEPDDYRAARLAARAAKYRTNVAHLRALRDETAGELCSHGMPLTNCLAHRETETETTEEQS